MYDCEIRYREGKRNGNADALSRIATEETAEDLANRVENKDFIINTVDAQVNAVRVEIGRIDDKQLEDPNIKWLSDALTQPDKPPSASRKRRTTNIRQTTQEIPNKWGQRVA